MTSKPLTTEAIAFTEKKMDMTLDDIIKMSKKKPSKGKKQRDSNKSKNIHSAQQNKAMKFRQYMDSRSSVRQGALAKRRTNFQGNRFPLASEAATKAVAAPFRNQAFNQNRRPNWIKTPRTGLPPRQQSNFSAGGAGMKECQEVLFPLLRRSQQYNHEQLGKPKTLDSLFASMQEQRMMNQAQPNNNLHGGMISGPQSSRHQPFGGRGQRYSY